MAEGQQIPKLIGLSSVQYVGCSAILLAVVVSKGFDQIVDDVMAVSTSDGWRDGKTPVRKEVGYKRPLRTQNSWESTPKP